MGSPAAFLREEPERWRGPGRLLGNAQDVVAQQKKRGRRGQRAQHQAPLQRHPR